MKEKSSSETKTDRVAMQRRTGKKHGPVQREVNEVMAELVLKLSQKLEPQPERAREKGGRRECVGPNRDRLTVGVELAGRWSNYCILGLDGETLAEGQLPTTQVRPPAGVIIGGSTDGQS
jgi:hypothetical protein